MFNLNREFEEAHSNFEKAISLDNKNCKFFHAKGLALQVIFFLFKRVSNFLQEEGKFEEAIENFEKALSIQNDHTPSIYHLGVMYKKIHRNQDALQAFSTVLQIMGEDCLVLKRYLSIINNK